MILKPGDILIDQTNLVGLIYMIVRLPFGRRKGPVKIFIIQSQTPNFRKGTLATVSLQRILEDKDKLLT